MTRSASGTDRNVTSLALAHVLPVDLEGHRPAGAQREAWLVVVGQDAPAAKCAV